MTAKKATDNINSGIDSFKTTSQKDLLQRLAKDGQNPEAIIVTCADSRVAPETLFSADLGQLFVIRVAGNVVGQNELASIEYAALALNVPLCVVVGHSSCGAVAASLEWHKDQKVPPTKALESLVKDIQPAVAAAEKTCKDADLLPGAIHENVKRVMKVITDNSPQLADRKKSGEFEIKGAVVNMDQATLQWID